MTDAGGVVFDRSTTIKHIETGVTITIDNSEIGADMPARSHLQQRNVGMAAMSKKLGVTVKKNECIFIFNQGRVS